MMREMGITVVRMAEFSWEKFEPREGEFRFVELDESIEAFAREGVVSVPGMPSAALRPMSQEFSYPDKICVFPLQTFVRCDTINPTHTRKGSVHHGGEEAGEA